MKQILTPDQVADLVMIQEICDELGADLVVIGATSLLLSIGDLGRFTRDEFAQLADRLTAAGWQRAAKLEHRWVAPAPDHCRPFASWTQPSPQWVDFMAG